MRDKKREYLLRMYQVGGGGKEEEGRKEGVREVSRWVEKRLVKAGKGGEVERGVERGEWGRDEGRDSCHEGCYVKRNPAYNIT